MVHFLVHGDDQKYVGPFSDCIRNISRGSKFSDAWDHSIGASEGFEDRWKTWWLAQPESPTRTLYGKAAVATMTSFVARAFAARQTFNDFEAFHAAVEDDSLKINPDDWLPRSLIVTAFRLYGNAPNWEIKTGTNRQPTVELTLSDGIRVSGSFVLNGARVEQVNVVVDDMANTLKESQTLLDAGKKEQARALVQAKLKEIPTSVMAMDARKFLQACR
jgi:hypothetical protein